MAADESYPPTDPSVLDTLNRAMDVIVHQTEEVIRLEKELDKYRAKKDVLTNAMDSWEQLNE